ncbi:MAG: hypothetical protein IJ100_07690 [Lachnospiraceae bacterium]|nr:hypothetical protein [Lachnospiraceae bacterium]
MSKIACLLVIILELLGFRISIADRKWKIFAYYTQISNLSTLASSLIFLFTDSAPWLRYTSACMLTMTFIVTACILAPFGGGYRNLLLSGNGLYHHTLCPVLSVISYLFWEPHSSAWGIPVAITFLYGITMLFMNWRGRFDGPYPFFRVRNQTPLATLLWMTALTAMITLISLAILLCTK